MRPLLVLLAAALLAFPAAAAQEDPGPGSDGPGPGDRDRQERDQKAHETPKERCERAPDAPKCRPCPAPDGEDREANATGNATEGNATRPAPCPPPPCQPPCPSACARQPDLPRCRKPDPIHFPAGQGRHLTFVPDGENRTVRDIRVDGRVVLTELALLSNATLHAERHGGVLLIAGDGVRIELHDNPTGQIRFKGENATVRLVFPPEAVPMDAGLTTRIQYPGGLETFLNAHWTMWDTDRVAVEDFFVFHVSNKPTPQAAAEPAMSPQLESRLADAANDRRLGAQVTLRHPRGATIAAVEQVEVVPFDDVNVTAHVPAVPAAGVPVRIVVSSDLEEGRTIALDVDPELVQTSDPKALLLRYFDVHDDGSETEVLFAQAASLADVLDPADDGGQPEYWVVSDATGLHILVSVPHWSVHAITVSSVVDFVTQPSVLVGITAGVLGSVGAAAVLLWPRRRRDDA